MTIEEIYTEYGSKVKAYIRSRVNNPQDVEDLQSEVFLKIQGKAEEYQQEKGSVSTWIYAITRNTVIDFYRTSKNMVSIDEDNEGELTPPQLIANEETDRELLQRETLAELAEAMEGLTAEEKRIIVFHYYDGLTLQQVAEKIGLSYGQTKLRHASALKKLKTFLLKKSAGGQILSYQ